MTKTCQGFLRFEKSWTPALEYDCFYKFVTNFSPDWQFVIFVNHGNQPWGMEPMTDLLQISALIGLTVFDTESKHDTTLQNTDRNWRQRGPKMGTIFFVRTNASPF